MKSDQSFVGRTIVAARQIEAIRCKIKKKKVILQSDDLQSLRTLCCCDDINIALMACDTIIHLVKHHNFPSSQAMSWCITSLQSNQHVFGIVKAITDLMVLSINNNSWEAYGSSNDILQHPLVLILNQADSNWITLDFQMNIMFSSLDEERVFAVLKPVFMFGLWSPSKDTSFSGCKRGIWKYLIQHGGVNVDFFVRTLCWIRTDDVNSILDTSYILNSFHDHPSFIMKEKFGNILSVISADTACKLATYGFDPTVCLNSTKTLLKLYPHSTDLVLIMFARNFLFCPAQYLNSFGQICADIIQNNQFGDVTIVWIVIASLLPWLCHSLQVFHKLSRTSDKVFVIAENECKDHTRTNHVQNLLDDKSFLIYATSNDAVFSALSILIKLETRSPKLIIDNICQIPGAEEDIQDNTLMNLFVSGILLATENDSYVQKRCLDILMKANPGFQLPLILYVLSKTSCSKLQLALLCSLVQTAVDKNNINPILSTLKSLTSKGQAMMIEISIKLHLELWKIENRCYPPLNEVLHKYKVVSPDVNWGRDAITAVVIKEICKIDSAKYGEEWVSLLSDIMNRCSEKYNSFPLTEVLDSILLLCNEKVVNVTTVYNELSNQDLFHDKRPEVVAKLCKLVAKIFIQTTENTIDYYRDTVVSALGTMWNLVTVSEHKDVVIAALKALSAFDVSLMPLHVVPNKYRKDLKKPADYLKLKKEGQDVENMIRCVPGGVWITFLESVSEEYRLEMCDLIASWLKVELSQLGRGFYRSIRGEPNDVSFLPDNSIFKAIVKYLTKLTIKSGSCSNEELQTVKLCFTVLNNEKITHVPLFNWTFLNYYISCNNAELTNLVVQYFAKQSGTSVSANKAIERYLKLLDVSANEDEILKIIFNILPEICCYLSPHVFSCIINPAMKICIEKIQEDRELFSMACKQFIKTLEKDNLGEHNRDALCSNVISLWELVSKFDNSDIIKLVQVFTKLPEAYVEQLIVVEKSDTSNCTKYRRLLKFIYLFSMIDNENSPFRWFNVMFDVSYRCYLKRCHNCSVREEYVALAADMLRENRTHTGKWTWILTFMNQIIKAVDDIECTMESANHMCNVLIFMIVTISSYFLLMRKLFPLVEYHLYFAQALNEVTFKDISGQVIEWLYLMIRSEKISRELKSLFKTAVTAMRYNPHLEKISVWNKIVSVF